VAMTSSLSVNQPLGRNQLLVCVGDGGILKKVAIPTARVIDPLLSFRKQKFLLTGLDLLNKKEPSPTCSTMEASHFENADC